jgi:hypothetical protein
VAAVVVAVVRVAAVADTVVIAPVAVAVDTVAAEADTANPSLSSNTWKPWGLGLRAFFLGGSELIRLCVESSHVVRWSRIAE